METDEEAKKTSGLSEFFSVLSKEKDDVRQKIKEQIDDPESGLSGLFLQLEEALQDTKKVSVEEDLDNTRLSDDDHNKLENLSNLLNSLSSDKQIPIKVEPEEIIPEEIIPEEIIPEELVVESEEPQDIMEPQNEIIASVIRNLDDMSGKTQVKEEVDQISSIRKEFDNFRSFISQQIGSLQMSGAGSGETRLEFLDDVDRDTAKVNGKALVYSSSDGKWKGESVLTGAITGLDIDGGTDIGAALADADLIIVDDGAGGTNRKAALSRLKTYIGAGAADDLGAGDAAVTLTTTSGNITIDAAANNSDIIFKGTDGGADITMLTLDGSADGAAIFKSTVTATAFVGDITGDVTGNADTATTLATARTIGGVSFDGSANINLPGVNSAGNQNTSGSAATLTTARTIGGVSFNGSANINLPGVNSAGNQNTSGSAATLTTARTIGGTSFDGSANIAVALATLATTVTITDNESTNEDNALIFTAGGDIDGGDLGLESDGTLTYNPSTGKVTATGFVGTLTGAVTGDVTGDVTGNADTATVLATARTIGGVSFNGSANINLPGVNSAGNQNTTGSAATLTTARTIGGTSFNGSANIDVALATLATTATVSDSTANTNFPVVFNDESNALLDDTGALRYNPSSGTLLVPNLVVAGTTTQVDTVTMNAANAVVFEGATADAHETTLTIIDPTADRTQRLINQSGYIPLLAATTTTAITSTPEELNILDGATVVVGEINALDLGSTAVGTAIASKAVILDSSKDYTGIRNLTISGEIDAATGDFSGVVDVAGATTTAAITASGIIKTDDTTAATSTTDGSLQTDGGLSVAADAVIGDDLFMLSDAAVVTFGADKDVTLTHVADTGLLLNAAMVVQFRDSAINIGSPADGDLDINADDEIELNSTLIDINGNVDISGTTLMTGVTTHGGNVVSDTDSTDDLGTTGVRWRALYVDAITATDQITATGFTGTLDGILGSGTPAAATVTTLTTSGDVGIGEAAPAQRLEVTETDATGFTGVRINNPNGNVGSAGVEFQVDTTYAKAAIFQTRKNANGNGDLIFAVDTNADAANWVAADEKLRINTNGNLQVAAGNLLFDTAAKGVYLGVTSATAANLLDDYEEGDWTPTIGTGTTVSSDAAYNASFTAGKYTKVGRVVHCSATLRLTDKGTQTGAISILGLPFASANNVGSRATWSSWFHGGADVDLTGNTAGMIMMFQSHNTSHILVRVMDPAGTAGENVEFADISDTVYVQISGSYVAA